MVSISTCNKLEAKSRGNPVMRRWGLGFFSPKKMCRDSGVGSRSRLSLQFNPKLEGKAMSFTTLQHDIEYAALFC